MNNMLLILLLLVNLLNQAPCNYLALATSITSFSFPSFTPQSCSDGTLKCTGTVTSNDGYLSLTKESTGSNYAAARYKVGRVLFKHPIFAWPADIYTTFTIRINPYPESSIGDGMSFIIAPNDSPSTPFVNSNDIGSSGESIGIMDRKLDGKAHDQIAVEFDTFMNGWDVDANHVGINTLSMRSPLVQRSLNSSGITLSSGKDIKVQIIYNQRTRILQVNMGYSSNPILVTVLNQSMNLSDTVPQSVYVGFTAATGTSIARYRVLDWHFTSIHATQLSSTSSTGSHDDM